MGIEGIYESPAIIELGDFAAETGYGLGDEVEGWLPLTDRPQ